MAILQALIAAVMRSLGKALNTVFGWATTTLFGKVPQDKQIYLSLNALGSVAWIAAVVGIAFPRAATFALTFVPVPSWVEPNWIRVAMLTIAALLPAGVGLSGLKMLAASDRPKTAWGFAKTILKGYPYTLGLSSAVLLMAIFAPYLKLKQLAHRRTAAHIPIIVESEDYDSVLSDLEDALERGGIVTRRERATWMLRLPAALLRFFAGSASSRFLSQDLTTLRSPGVDVTLYPSDLIVEGESKQVARARAVLAENLTITRAYMTWTKEANALEDGVQDAWTRLGSGEEASSVIARAESLARKLRRTELPFEEWEVIFRQLLQVKDAAHERGVRNARQRSLDRARAAILADRARERGWLPRSSALEESTTRRSDGASRDGAGGLAVAQGLFYALSGSWPVVSLRSFEAVTGPKADGWLVKTVGGLLDVVGVSLMAAGRRRPVPPAAVTLGMGTAAVLAASSLWYSLRGRIPRIYLLDGALEAALVGAYLGILSCEAKPQGRPRQEAERSTRRPKRPAIAGAR